MMNRLFRNITAAAQIRQTAKLPLIAAAIFLCLRASSYAQTSRTEAMGGLSYSVSDQDNSLTPFDFAGNPAWLYLDKQESYLNMKPSVSNSWGSFRRKYDSEGTYNAAADVEEVRILDSLGTFLGRASYSYENRRNYYRILKKDPYAGEGFFYTDTTSGNFKYHGPSVQLMYSWELLPRLYAGGSASYGLIEGLKEVYTYAKTIYREIDLSAGLAYRFSDHFIVGALVEYFDSQESIFSQDINSYIIMVRNFRGEKYFIPSQNTSVTEKAKKNKARYGGHLYYEIAPSVQFAARADYSNSSSKMIAPWGNLIVEEGYASFENIDAQLQTRFIISPDLLTAINFTFLDDRSWSKNSRANLLLWDWHTRQMSLGAGASYRIASPLLLAFECGFARSSLDSSKYIDDKYISLISNDILVKAGAEYEAAPGLILRAGYNRGFFEEGMMYGGKDVALNSYTAGAGISILNGVMADACIKYAEYSADNSPESKRSFLGGYLAVRLSSFWQ